MITRLFTWKRTRPANTPLTSQERRHLVIYGRSASRLRRATAAQAALRDHDPLAVGRASAAGTGRNEAEQGAIAWQHYRFGGPDGTDQIADAAGTSGTTGIISSGVFADQPDEERTE